MSDKMVSVCPCEKTGKYAVAFLSETTDPELIKYNSIVIPNEGPHDIINAAHTVIVGSAIDMAELQAAGVPLDERWISIYALSAVASWAKKTEHRMYTQKAIFTALEAKPIVEAPNTAEESTAIMHLLAASLMVTKGWLNLDEQFTAYLAVEREFTHKLATWVQAPWRFNREELERTRRMASADAQAARDRIERQLDVKLSANPTHHTVAQKIELGTGITRPVNEHGELVWTDATVMKFASHRDFGPVFQCWHDWRRAAAFETEALAIFAHTDEVRFDVYSPLPNGGAASIPRTSRMMAAFMLGVVEFVGVQEESVLGWIMLKKQIIQETRTIEALVPVEGGFLVRFEPFKG